MRMDYYKYQTLARRTESISPEVYKEYELDYRLDHCLKGLITESIELLASEDECNEVEEIGDIFWYLDLGCSVFGKIIGDLPFVSIKTDRTDLDYILIYIGDFADLLKRKKFYNREDLEFDKKTLHIFALIFSHLVSICTGKDISLSDVLEKNIEKLKIRMPKEYTDELAINRDLEKERSVFE